LGCSCPWQEESLQANKILNAVKLTECVCY
jgi:hypothetical protein